MTSRTPLSMYRPSCVLQLCVAGSLVLSSSSKAAQWQLGSGVRTDLSHTRTVDGTADKATSSEAVWGISPYLSLSGRGKSLDVNARLGIDHTRNIDSGHTATRPAASIDGEFTVIDRRAWVSVGANVAQQRESSNGSAEDFLVNLDSESTQVDFSLSERGSLPLGPTSRVNGAHRFSTSDVSGDGEQTSQTHILNIDTISYMQSARSFVVTDLNIQHTDIGDSGTFKSGEAAVGIGMSVLDIATEVMLSIGHEWQDLMVDDQDLDGYFWAVGLRWQPIESVQFEAGYGERAYGRTPHLRVSLIGRRNSLSVSWSRQLAFQRNSQSGVTFPDTASTDVGSADVDDIGEPDALGEQTSLSPFVDDVQSVDEEIRLDHEFRGRASTLSSGIGVSKRSSISDSDSSESTLTFATLDLTRAIGQSVSATVGFRVAESEDEGLGDKQRVNRIRLAVTWRF